MPGRQTLRWSNGTSIVIKGNYTTEGTFPKGSSWAQNPLPYSNGASPPEFPPPCNERSGTPRNGGGSAAACSAKPLASGPAKGYIECRSSFCNTGKDYAFAGNVAFEACVAQCKAANCTCFDYDATSTGRHPFEHCRVSAAAQRAVAVPSSAHYAAYRRGPNKPAGGANPPSQLGGLVDDGYCSGEFPYMSMILDEVVVPASINPGEYVLGFRESDLPAHQLLRAADRFILRQVSSR